MIRTQESRYIQQNIMSLIKKMAVGNLQYNIFVRENTIEVNIKLIDQKN